MRVRTNVHFSIVYPKAPKPRYGVILGGSKGCDGPAIIRCDDLKHPRPMLLNFIDVFLDDLNDWRPADFIVEQNS